MLRHVIACSAALGTLALLSCGGPVGPPLGLGPGMDAIVSLLLMLVVAILLWQVWRRLTTRGHASSAKSTLTHRYVQGEIDRPEYLEKLRDIEDAIR